MTGEKIYEEAICNNWNFTFPGISIITIHPSHIVKKPANPEKAEKVFTTY